MTLRTITAADRDRIAAHYRAKKQAHDHAYTIQNPTPGFEGHAVCERCGFSLPKDRAEKVMSDHDRAAAFRVSNDPRAIPVTRSSR